MLLLVPFYQPYLEGLRNSKVNVSSIQSIDSWCPVKQNPSRSSLGNQKLRWIQKVSIVNSECSTQRCLKPESESDSVAPARSQVVSVNGSQYVAWWNRSWIRFTKEITDPAIHVAAVVKWNDLENAC